ncbi:MAG: GIY-YIG nuclease family protein [Candidatus Anammoxibacter sp.]
MQRGIYNLIIYLNSDRNIKVGKLGRFNFKKGFYIYTGSSQNSLQKRIERHLAAEKKLHWHIDYMLKYGRIIKVRVIESLKKDECELSNEIGLLRDAKVIVDGFGSSDCTCKTHLYFFRKQPTFKTDKSDKNTSILRNMEEYML